MSTSSTGTHRALSTHAVKSSKKSSSSMDAVKMIATASFSPSHIPIFTAIPVSSFIASNPPTTTSLVGVPTQSSSNDINSSSSSSSTTQQYMPLFCVLAGAVAAGIGMLVWLICKRKRKLDTEAWQQHTTGWSSCQSTLRNDASPVVYPQQTLKQHQQLPCKRLTAETLVAAEERASFSTLVSRRQYAPQLAYSPSKQSLNRHSDGNSTLYGVSPSATLTDHLGVATTDPEKGEKY